MIRLYFKDLSNFSVMPELLPEIAESGFAPEAAQVLQGPSGHTGRFACKYTVTVAGRNYLEY